GDGALLPRQRGIVDDRRLLAAPAQDVAIDRVPAGVADAAGEPASVDAGIGIEHLLGRLDPVDVPRRFSPKTLRVALPARIDVVVTAGAGVHGTFSLGGSPSRWYGLHFEAVRQLCKSRESHKSAMRQDAGARRRLAVWSSAPACPPLLSPPPPVLPDTL